MTSQTNTPNASAATTAQEWFEKMQFAQAVNEPKAMPLKEQLAFCIADSQDGNPHRALTEEVSVGRLSSVCDNLNRLLADEINNAAEEGDIETLTANLVYCQQQLALAERAITKRFRSRL